MADVRLTVAGRGDLKNIRRYTLSAFGAVLARDYLLGLRGTFDRLLERPLIGVPQSGVAPGLRKFVYRSHVIYYRPAATGIDIVRVLHHAQDATGRFQDA